VRLLLVELDRFRSRRAIVLMLLAAALLTGLLAGTAIWDTRPVSDADRAAAVASANAAAQDPELIRDIADCRENPTDFFGPDTTSSECDRYLTPRPQDYLPRNELHLGAVLENRGLVAVALVSALLVISGATFAGGDWATGSMSTQLLFRPRRTMVWAIKAAAVLIAALVTSAVFIAGFWAALVLTVNSRDIPVPDAVMTEIGWMTFRGVGLAAAGAVGAYALTMLFRSTVGTLSALFVYAVGGEALLLALPLERASQWSLANNVVAWINDGKRVFDADVTCAPGLDACEQSYVLGLPHAAAYLGVLLALALVASWLAFRRSDVV
jgi:ABC-2 type transport system permease protein